VTASPTVLGLITGLVLGLAAAFGGLGAFVIVLLFGAIGLGVGRYLEGELDLSALSGRGGDRANRLR
jgi:nitrate/nitrite transporter NarK